jgi:hypothetical protein
MSLHQANDTRLDRTAFDALTTTPADPDPWVQVTEDIYEHFSLEGEVEGSKTGRKLAFNADQVVRTSAINRMFPGVVVSGISPATGAAAGGTTVTITGTNLDLVTAVEFGTGNDGTDLAIANDGQSLTVVTPAVSAGADDVILTADSGDVTEVDGFTFA